MSAVLAAATEREVYLRRLTGKSNVLKVDEPDELEKKYFKDISD
jgi:hypothetical protein